MSTVIFIFAGAASLLAILMPWIGVIGYYTLALSQAQSFYPWEFEGSRLTLIVAAATFVGLILAIAMRKADPRVFVCKQNILFLLLVLWVNISYSQSAFNDLLDPVSEFTPEFILGTFNKIAVFYLFATMVINDKVRLLALIYMFAAVTIFYTAWSNKVYFTSELWRFGDNGRLNGPIGSLYWDENYLAMVFVLGTPVLFYLGLSARNIVIKYGLWFIIPLCWHGLFLTGSRGGLVSLSAVCTYMFFRSYSKMIPYIMVAGLVTAVIFQSGQLLVRVDSTIEASEVPTEKALDPRLISWQVGYEILSDYPLFGVGVGNFINAFSTYDDTKPHVAHNTFLQFSADSGIVPGVIYLLFFYLQFKVFLKKRQQIKSKGKSVNIQEVYIDDIINCLYLGFFTIALFLDLMLYEFLYFIILLGFSKYLMDNPFKTDTFRINVDNSIYKNTDRDSIYQEKQPTLAQQRKV